MLSSDSIMGVTNRFLPCDLSVLVGVYCLGLGAKLGTFKGTDQITSTLLSTNSRQSVPNFDTRECIWAREYLSV